MAPEQVDGGAASALSDIYSLGIVLFEMVTAARPFVGTTSMATAVKRIKEDPPSPHLFKPELDLRWEAVILRALAR